MNGVASWEPATDAEVALYDALAAGNQEGYFQALARINLLLPVSADAAAGRSPVGWGTWTANNHTHLLAFTSDRSMRTCLAQHAGGARRMSLRELSAVWPNNDWWLAVNPGLPIEGYLPAWFVAQLARGDARLPGRRSSMPRDRLERVQALERAKAAKAAAPSREPIRTVATAGGPLALPPASASPRWARGPSSIVDAEEVPAALPTRTPARPMMHERPTAPERPGSPLPERPVAPERDQSQVLPGSPLPVRIPQATRASSGSTMQPPSGRPARPPMQSPPGQSARPPVVPETYQSAPPPPPPSRPPYGTYAGQQDAPQAPGNAPPAAGQPISTGAGWPMPPLERPASLAEDRWAALSESRWAALSQDRTGTEHQQAAYPQATQQQADYQAAAHQPVTHQPAAHQEAGQGQADRPQGERRPAGRRSLFEAARPAQAEPVTQQPATRWPEAQVQQPEMRQPATQWPEARWPDTQAQQPEMRQPETQRAERRSLFEAARPARAEEPVTERLERRSLFEAVRPVGTEEPAAQRVERRSLFEEVPPARPEESEPPAVEVRPAVGEETPAAAAEEKKQNARTEGPRHAEPEPEFVPANAVEEQLYAAAEAGNTDAFLSTLLLATVLIPKASGTTDGKWRPQPIDGEPHIVSYTSTQHLAEPLETIPIKFIKLISDWPDPNWSFAVNPGTPVGATLPGGQLLALANWAAEVGLGGDDEEEGFDEPSVKHNGTPVAGRVSAEVPVLQKAIAPSQVGYYLERGYDRVTGFVHRAHEVGHLKSASQMRAALGLDFEGSPFSVEADEIYLLRWSAYRPNLYRIPYGGQSESAMHAMQGWVIERAPFRGNGFAPGETNEVIAEFKVDSARLPHGARLLRLKDGAEELVAIFDADTQKWLRTDGGS